MFRIRKTLLSLFPFPQNKKTMLFLEANYHSVFNWLKFFFVIYNIIFLNSCVLLEMKKLTFFVFYIYKIVLC